MPILNGGFEEAVEGPGQARHWRLRTRVQAEVIAGFGPAPRRAPEDFERWFAAFERTLSLATVAVFEPERDAFESFGGGWANDLYVRELPNGGVSRATFDGSPIEAMSAGWSVEPYVHAWVEVSSERARFELSDADSFEGGWRENERYVRDWALVDRTPASFDSSLVEHFTDTWQRAATL